MRCWSWAAFWVWVLPACRRAASRTPDRLSICWFRFRQELRGAKQYELADSVRDRLTDLGVALEDTRDGTRWRRVQPEPEAVEEEPGANSLVESALRF